MAEKGGDLARVGGEGDPVHCQHPLPAPQLAELLAQSLYPDARHQTLRLSAQGNGYKSRLCITLNENSVYS